MISQNALKQARSIFNRALITYGASCCPVYRQERDKNGVPTGPARRVGCVYGVRYERGQTANVLTDIPGVIARTDAPRLCCSLSGCARGLIVGDAILCKGAWYSVLRADVQMDILCDIVLKEGGEPDGIQI